MAQMKFEDQLKEKLEARRLEPTASAWDRIEGKLAAEQGKKKSMAVLWMAIAASFVAGVFLTAVIYSGAGDEERNELVDLPENSEEIENSKKDRSNIFEVIEEAQVAQTPENETAKAQEALGENNTDSQKESSKNQKSTSTEVSNPTKKEAGTRYTPRPSTIPEVQTGIAQTTDESHKSREPHKGGVSEETINEVVATVSLDLETEADVLLREAQREMMSKQVFDAGSPYRVDANALLLDVEAEVDPDTFKDKIFNTLKSGFEKAVESVANKDN